MQETKRRRIGHESAPSFVRKHYSIGDTVGIQIHKVDRAHTDSKILPCQVLDIKIINDSTSFKTIILIPDQEFLPIVVDYIKQSLELRK